MAGRSGNRRLDSMAAPVLKASGKPRVVFVIDRPGWAYDIVSRNVAAQLADDYDFRIICQAERAYKDQIQEDADLWIFHHLSMADKHGAGRKYLVKMSGYRCLEVFNEKGDAGQKRLGDMLGGQHIITTNNGLTEIAQKYSPHVRMIQNGLDLEMFRPHRTMAKEFTVGFCASITNQKRIRYKGFSYVDVACEALDVKLNVSAYNARQDAPGLPYAKMPAFYRRISCLVHPSKEEGSSNAVMEALACGIPVITTRTGYHGEMLTDDLNVLFAERTAVDVQALVWFAKAFPLTMGQIAKAGREFAEEHHDIRKVAQLWKAAIEERLATK